MATFRAIAEVSYLVELEFEADSLDQAWVKAKEADGADFTMMDESHMSDGWQIVDVEWVSNYSPKKER